MKKILIAIVAASLMAGWTWDESAGAQTYPGTRAPELEAKLPTPVRVYCTTNTSFSFALIGRGEIYLGAWECQKLLREAPSTDGGGYFPWSFAAHTLYHEWWHLAFSEYDEKDADEGALAILRYMLRTKWGMDAAEAQRHYRAVAGYTHYLGRSYSPDAADPLLGVL